MGLGYVYIAFLAIGARLHKSFEVPVCPHMAYVPVWLYKVEGWEVVGSGCSPKILHCMF